MSISDYAGVIRRYASYLPIDECFIVSLHEGNTPLLEVPQLAKKIFPGLHVFLKFEGLNPTGSFKDRGMTYAVSKALEKGKKAIICASTGNTSAAAAAYAARAGIKAIVLLPKGKIALGKLSQALIHGAQVIQIRGNFDEALEIVRKVAERDEFELVNSVNPNRLLGQRTAAYEVCDTLGDAPKYHALPVGNAGNITAYWKGYQKYFTEKKISKCPIMLGFQAAGAAPIVKGEIVNNPETVASAIRIGNPANWKSAEEARDQSGGLIDAVSDEEILAAYQLLAATTGYFAEPASATGIAGLLKLAKQDFFKKGDCVVCTLTGHGLKDPDNAIAKSDSPETLDADLDQVLAAIEL
jgi:threonine synthase